jgi:hypothetical protein
MDIAAVPPPIDIPPVPALIVVDEAPVVLPITTVFAAAPVPKLIVCAPELAPMETDPVEVPPLIFTPPEFDSIFTPPPAPVAVIETAVAVVLFEVKVLVNVPELKFTFAEAVPKDGILKKEGRSVAALGTNINVFTVELSSPVVEVVLLTAAACPA